MVKNGFEICTCIRLHYKELWKAKQTINSKNTRLLLRNLSNPDCSRCKGTGLRFF